MNLRYLFDFVAYRIGWTETGLSLECRRYATSISCTVSVTLI